MTHTTKLLTFTIANVFLTISIPLLFGGELVPLLTSNGVYFYAVIFSALGSLMGYLLSKINKRINEGKAYYFGLSVSTLALTTLILTVSYSGWKQQQMEANIEHNTDIMDGFVDEDEQYVKVAFNKLQSLFDNPNSIKLNSFHIRTKDTTVNQTADTVHLVYLTYFTTSDQDKELLARFEVFRNIPSLDFLNKDLESDKEFSLMKAEFDRKSANVIPSMNASIDSLPEPQRAEAKKIMHETLKH